MAALSPDTAFDFNERARGEVGEVGTPFARRVELKFANKFRPLECVPEVFEAAFEFGGLAARAWSVECDGFAIASMDRLSGEGALKRSSRCLSHTEKTFTLGSIVDKKKVQL